MAITFKTTPPTLEEYLSMREEVGFRKLSHRIAQNGISNSSYIITAFDGEKIVAMARLLSDGGYVNFISDVIVIPKYQHLGIGKELVNRIISHLKTTLSPEEKIAVYLMSAKGKESFYRKLGFDERENTIGAGMSQWITKD